MKLAYCGIDCEKCIRYKGRGAEVAKKLLEIIKESGLDEWYEFAERPDFDYKSFKTGLKWIAGMNCPGCQEAGNPECPVWQCASKRQVKTCKDCPEFPNCEPIRRLKEEWGMGNPFL